MSPLQLGERGYYGMYNIPEKNLIVSKINKLIDEYNSSINSFNTREEQIHFENIINDKIDYFIKML